MIDRMKRKGTFDVYVGDELFTLERTLFLRQSTFFREAVKKAEDHLSKGEALEPIDLHDESYASTAKPEDFAIYVEFFKSGDVAIPTDENTWVFLTRFWALCYQLGDFTAANRTMDAILDETKEKNITPDLNDVIEIYAFRGLHIDCPLKRLIVDFQIHEPDDLLTEPFNERPDRHYEVFIDFLQDVALEFRSLARSNQPRGRFLGDDDLFKQRVSTRDKCRYHEHDDDHPESDCTERSSGEDSEEA